MRTESSLARVAAGAKVNSAEKRYRHTMLMATSDPEMARTLVRAGADLGARAPNGSTALILLAGRAAHV
jgi:hypothetical protein